MKDTQASCELIIRKCEEDAKAAREELELCRAQIGLDGTRIKILIDKYPEQLNRKIEKTLSRAWQEWSAQTVELHIVAKFCLRVSLERDRRGLGPGRQKG